MAVLGQTHYASTLPYLVPILLFQIPTCSLKKKQQQQKSNDNLVCLEYQSYDFVESPVTFTQTRLTLTLKRFVFRLTEPFGHDILNESIRVVYSKGLPIWKPRNDIGEAHLL